MLINQLSPTPNSKRTGKRLGRGIGSGLGKTSGKGGKGQTARSGKQTRVNFEGGQTPLTRRLPKQGFTNNFSKSYSCVNIGDFADFKAGTVVTAELLLEKGILSKIEAYGLKVLGDGEIKVALTVKAAAFTKSAVAKITKAGGKAEIIKNIKDNK
jgi:large subunit ribosomal protein L15